jgi:phage tail-like protein
MDLDQKSQLAATRDVPFPQNRFKLKVDALGDIGHYTQVQGLSGTVDVMEYPEGGRNDYVHKLPTRIKYGNITLKRGLTHEQNLLAWFQATVVEAKPTSVSLTALDGEGKPIKTWAFASAFPVKWTGPDANAGGSEIMTESLEIAHHGIEVHS